MQPLNLIFVWLRVIQITVAILAFLIALIAVLDDSSSDGYYGEPNGFLLVAGMICWCKTAAFGGVGLLVFLRPADMAWYLALFFETWSFAAIVAATQCVSNLEGWYRHHVPLRVITNISYVCMVPIVISILRTIRIGFREERWVHAWWQERDLRRFYPKTHSDVYTPDEIQRLEKRIEELETAARARPLSTTDTVARWTTYSSETLPDHQSESALPI